MPKVMLPDTNEGHTRIGVYRDVLIEVSAASGSALVGIKFGVAQSTFVPCSRRSEDWPDLRYPPSQKDKMIVFQAWTSGYGISYSRLALKA